MCTMRLNWSECVLFFVQNQNSPRRSKSIKHKNGESIRYLRKRKIIPEPMSSNPNFGDLLVLAVWTGSTVMFFSSPPPGEIGGSISSEPYKVINPPFVLVVWKLKLSPLVLYSAKYWLCFLVCVSFQYNYNTGISYETLGPDEVRSLLTTVSNSLERTQACFHSLFLIYSFIHLFTALLFYLNRCLSLK